MLKKFKVALAGGVVAAGAVILPAAVATPAAAATPNASCRVYADLGLNFWTLPGQVSANGRACVPNPQVGGVLQNLNAGVPCGSDRWFGNWHIGAACN